MGASGGLWSFFVDRGGTFTDIVARAPDGRLLTRKLLSENPDHYEDASVAGIRAILRDAEGLADADAFPAHRIAAIKLGTTVATNALLTRTGASTVLAITEGFGDALRIGAQNRPRLFDLNIVLPDMLYADVVEIPERLGCDGRVIRPFDETATRARLAASYAKGLRAIAIVLMHGYRHSAHERRVAEIAAEIGFTEIAASHTVSPLIKLVPRGDTTVADAYLSPVLRKHIDRVAAATGGARLLFMQSNGGLADGAHVSGKDAVLSGPAGGVVGAAETARAAGFADVIGFDMGGTSTDVCHIGAGDYDRSFETTVAGVRLRAPMLQVHTVAAGGGSILHFDGLRFRVGPDSAGANPGPACYGKGGPLTITDANLLLGKINPAHFPKVFGPRGDAPLDADVVERRFAALAARVSAALGQTRTSEDLARGFIALAVDNMARAIRRVSVERGYDIGTYVLACFGGAGGQHACLVADALNMRRVFIHPFASVLSAYGIGRAPLSAFESRTVESPLTQGGLDAARATLDALDKELVARLSAQGVAAKDIHVVRRLSLKYAGTDTALAVTEDSLDVMTDTFTAHHRRQFGFVMNGQSLTIESVAVEASGRGGDAPGTAQVIRPDIAAGATIEGPLVLTDALSTTVVEPGWSVTALTDGALVLRKTGVAPMPAEDAAPDPMRIEIFNNLFMSIAEQMGAVLQNTAQSVNIKERLDFSCAVFDPAGNLIANAPHIPVHLGSMSDCVRAVRAKHAAMQDGDAFVLNNPYAGGTHLPDITVVTPVFIDGQPRFFVASRGHHADIGGITPGSMPPGSRTLAEEGLLLDNIHLVRDHIFQEDAIRAVLTQGPHPARNVAVNLADLRAQVGANAKGVEELRRASALYGPRTMAAYMGHVQDHAAEAVRRLIPRLRSGRFTCPTDEGGVVTVAVTVDHAQRRAVIDFTGTSAQRPGNFNAPGAVCRAAVLYVFRTLIADEIPMNEGVLRPLTLVIPEGSMLNPKPPAAVVAGNVETSQIICDALYGALGVLAGSQGTMNNFTFGNARHQYYETIAGGAGAGDGFDGASAVQTHMTNSRLTDPEVLEQRFPVTVERFAIRRGSGGNGRHRGGDGVIRELKFHDAMTAGILSGRRATRPFGLAGGCDGAPGATALIRKDGTRQSFGATGAAEVEPGDVIVIATPGGGGYGDPERPDDNLTAGAFS